MPEVYEFSSPRDYFAENPPKGLVYQRGFSDDIPVEVFMEPDTRGPVARFLGVNKPRVVAQVLWIADTKRRLRIRVWAGEWEEQILWYAKEFENRYRDVDGTGWTVEVVGGKNGGAS